jgi:hypothetical protein
VILRFVCPLPQRLTIWRVNRGKTAAMLSCRSLIGSLMLHPGALCSSIQACDFSLIQSSASFSLANPKTLAGWGHGDVWGACLSNLFPRVFKLPVGETINAGPCVNLGFALLASKGPVLLFGVGLSLGRVNSSAELGRAFEVLNRMCSASHAENMRRHQPIFQPRSPPQSN